MTKPKHPSTLAALWLTYGLAAGGLIIAATVRPRAASGSDPYRMAGVARTLGTGGSFSNHTLVNDKTVDMVGWSFRFLNMDPGNILDTFTTSGWTNTSIIVPPGTSETQLWWDNSLNTAVVVHPTASVHFGYQLAAGVSTTANSVLGIWRDASGASYGVKAATVHQYYTPAVATVTPSATPTSTPSPPPFQFPSLSARLSTSLTPSNRQLVSAAGSPPWVGLRITNTWESELPIADRTILIQRYVKIVPPQQRITLSELIDDSDLIDGALLLDERPQSIPFGQGIDTHIGPLSNEVTGVVVYYSAKPERPQGDELRNTPAYTAFLGLELIPEGTAVPSTPAISSTPIPTRPQPYFPYLLRSHDMHGTVNSNTP